MMKIKNLTLAISVTLLAGTSYAQTTLSVAFNENPDTNHYKAIDSMRQKLEELSHGEMTLKLYPSDQLGKLKDVLQQVSHGEIDMTLQGLPDMSFLIPELKVIGEPYVIRDMEHLRKVMASPYGQGLLGKIEDKGIKTIDLWYLGIRQTTSNRPINSITDMKGLKLRVPDVDFLMDYAKACGARPVPISSQETYLALQTNQIDAQENPLPSIYSFKFNEVQKNLAITNHFIANKAVQVSKSRWDSLTSEQQGWLKQASQAGRELNDKLMYEDEAKLLIKFKAEGINVTYPDLAPYREAMKPYYQKLDDKFGAGVVEKIQAIQ
ncbi:MAG: DctP family TRAP transporter solute-binding subunit [Vibrio sp.]|uniref:DctP family TRAP transporter solute-binding subunit n=1 Tax=Vibrio sp. TaxID=678 RepID=UPI003A86AAEE